MTYCDLSSILKDGYVFTLDAEVTVNNLQRLLTNRNLLKKKNVVACGLSLPRIVQCFFLYYFFVYLV